MADTPVSSHCVMHVTASLHIGSPWQALPSVQHDRARHVSHCVGPNDVAVHDGPPPAPPAPPVPPVPPGSPLHTYADCVTSPWSRIPLSFVSTPTSIRSP